MYETIFLIVLAVLWMGFASVQDWKTRSISNWISFSLIIFALGFRFFYSLFSSSLHDMSFGFFYQGLIGLGIFFVLGNLFYYGRVFAGGDAKLMIALGAVLPFTWNFFVNLEILALFLFLFFLTGGAYGILWSIFIISRHFSYFKKEFKARLAKNKKMLNFFMLFSLIVFALGFYEIFFVYLGIFSLFAPFLYFGAKAADECMVKNIKAKNLEEGDLLYKNLKIKGKTINAEGYGLSEKEIKEIRKRFKIVKIKEGIPFVPVFLIGFLLLVYFYFWNFLIIENLLGSLF